MDVPSSVKYFVRRLSVFCVLCSLSTVVFNEGGCIYFFPLIISP